MNLGISKPPVGPFSPRTIERTPNRTRPDTGRASGNRPRYRYDVLRALDYLGTPVSPYGTAAGW
ncbi:MAG TPA: hypothetical protein VKH82_02285 [Candidatus Binatia bacterium]|nr:hypothetical protein [Candidatus Binatia bacterium]